MFWHPETKKIFISNVAEFDERKFPGNSANIPDAPRPSLPSFYSPDDRTTNDKDVLDQVGDDWIDGDPMSLSHFPGSTPAPKASQDEQPTFPKQEPTPERPKTPPTPQTPPPAHSSTPPPNSPPPVTPVHSPQQERSKRPLTSPASDILSPEHVRSKGNPPMRPRPQAPEFTAQPMSDFRPGRTRAYGRFQHISHYPPFRTGPTEPLGEPFTLNIPQTLVKILCKRRHRYELI